MSINHQLLHFVLIFAISIFSAFLLRPAEAYHSLVTLNSPPRQHMALITGVHLEKHYCLVAGGRNHDGDYFSNVDLIDVHTGESFAIQSLNGPRSNMVGLWASDSFFLLGGETGPAAASSTFVVFDFESQDWIHSSYMIEPRRYFAGDVCKMDDSTFRIVSGGGMGDGGFLSNTIEEVFLFGYQIKDTGATLSVRRSHLTATCISIANVPYTLFAGGFGSDGNAVDALEIYNVETNSIQYRSLAAPRGRLAAVQLHNNFIFAGGQEAINAEMGSDKMDIVTDDFQNDHGSLDQSIFCISAASDGSLAAVGDATTLTFGYFSPTLGPVFEPVSGITFRHFGYVSLIHYGGTTLVAYAGGETLSNTVEFLDPIMFSSTAAYQSSTLMHWLSISSYLFSLSANQYHSSVSAYQSATSAHQFSTSVYQYHSSVSAYQFSTSAYQYHSSVSAHQLSISAYQYHSSVSAYLFSLSSVFESSTSAIDYSIRSRQSALSVASLSNSMDSTDEDAQKNDFLGSNWIILAAVGGSLLMLALLGLLWKRRQSANNKPKPIPSHSSFEMSASKSLSSGTPNANGFELEKPVYISSHNDLVYASISDPEVGTYSDVVPNAANVPQYHVPGQVSSTYDILQKGNTSNYTDLDF